MSRAAPLERRILHVDCDMFFVQVARLEDPVGLGEEDLILVGGSPEGRGVVTSASYGARAYGARSGMPMSQAVRLCPDAVVVGVPRQACGQKSREVRQALGDFSPVLEAASIDEFYLDLTGTERLYRGETLEQIAERVRRVVRERTQIAVSVGGATRRMVAKMATRLAKPDGVHIVPPGAEAAFLRGLDLAQIPGVGPVLAETLRKRGLVSVPDALDYDRDALVAWLGESRGAWLYDRIRGIDPTPIETRRETKSISTERTFSRDVVELETLERQLVRNASELAVDLRRKGLRARTIRVYVRDRDFKDRQLAVTPGEAVETEAAIHRIARPLLIELWNRRSIGVRLIGIGATGLVGPEVAEQIRLLDDSQPLETERERTAARAADALRARFGADSIAPAAALPRRGQGR